MQALATAWLCMQVLCCCLLHHAQNGMYSAELLVTSMPAPSQLQRVIQGCSLMLGSCAHLHRLEHSF